MKQVVKRLHQVNSGEIFDWIKPIFPNLKGKMIRVFGTKYNVLCLTSFQIGQVDYNEQVRVIGRLETNIFSNEPSSRFDELFGAAVNNLHEFYDELGDADIVSQVKELVEEVDTGNDQKDYECIKYSVEKHIQNLIENRI